VPAPANSRFSRNFETPRWHKFFCPLSRFRHDRRIRCDQLGKQKGSGRGRVVRIEMFTLRGARASSFWAIGNPGAWPVPRSVAFRPCGPSDANHKAKSALMALCRRRQERQAPFTQQLRKSLQARAVGVRSEWNLQKLLGKRCINTAHPYLHRYIARTRLFFGLCSSLHKPSASRSGGT